LVKTKKEFFFFFKLDPFHFFSIHFVLQNAAQSGLKSAIIITNNCMLSNYYCIVSSSIGEV
jgi:hypothetical protein